MKNDNERIKEKIEFFMDEKIDVHIKLQDKTFLNGVITKELKPGVYWMEETKLGEIFLFLSDVFEIEQFNINKRLKR